jgi:hypothetical protein
MIIYNKQPVFTKVHVHATLHIFPVPLLIMVGPL